MSCNYPRATRTLSWPFEHSLPILRRSRPRRWAGPLGGWVKGEEYEETVSLPGTLIDCGILWKQGGNKTGEFVGAEQGMSW